MKKSPVPKKNIIKGLWAFILGITGGIISSFIYDLIKKVPFGTNVLKFFSVVFSFMVKPVVAFTVPVIIPVWLVFLAFIGIIFFTIWYIFWRKILIEVINGRNIPVDGKDHIAGTDTAIFYIDKKRVKRLIDLGAARIVPRRPIIQKVK